MPDIIEKISIDKLDVEEKKVKLKHVILEDLEINIGTKVLRVDKLVIDEMELDKDGLVF